MVATDIWNRVLFLFSKCASYKDQSRCKGLELVYSDLPSIAVKYSLKQTSKCYVIMTRLKLNLNLTVALPVQAGLADYLFSEGYAAHITKLQFTLEQQLHAMASAVAAYFPEGTACRLPKGGLFLWVELPAGVDAMTLYELALKHKIMLCPGGIFSMLGSYKHCIRLTVGISENPIFQQALKQIGLLAKQLIPR